jgi:hypothetical protein
MCNGLFSNNHELIVKQALDQEVPSLVFLLAVVGSASNFIVVRLHFYHVDESPQFLRLQESLHLEPSHVILTFKFCDEWAHNLQTIRVHGHLQETTMIESDTKILSEMT